MLVVVGLVRQTRCVEAATGLADEMSERGCSRVSKA